MHIPYSCKYCGEDVDLSDDKTFSCNDDTVICSECMIDIDDEDLECN